jgi:regulatory protein NPR1
MDYHKSTEEGKASPKERLCIEILEQAERRDPLLGEASLSLAMAGDDLRMKLLYLENRGNFHYIHISSFEVLCLDYICLVTINMIISF